MSYGYLTTNLIKSCGWLNENIKKNAVRAGAGTAFELRDKKTT